MRERAERFAAAIARGHARPRRGQVVECAITRLPDGVTLRGFRCDETPVAFAFTVIEPATRSFGVPLAGPGAARGVELARLGYRVFALDDPAEAVVEELAAQAFATFSEQQPPRWVDTAPAAAGGDDSTITGGTSTRPGGAVRALRARNGGSPNLHGAGAARAYFESDAVWAETPEPYQVQLRETVRGLVGDPQSRVLDVGCGNGLVTNFLAREFDVTALDLSATALRAVRARRCQGSITALPFAGGSFDFVYCLDVLEHLPWDQACIAMGELQRVARGRVLVSLPLNEDLASNSVECARCGTVYHVNGHLRSHDVPSLLDLPAAPGFRAAAIYLSGDVTVPPHSPFTALLRRHGIGAYAAHMQCPHCGRAQPELDAVETGRQEAAELLQRMAGALRAEAAAADQPCHRDWLDRSEGMVLFTRGADAASLPPATGAPWPQDRWMVHFDSLQQAVDDFVPGSMEPRFVPGKGTHLSSRGIELAAPGEAQASPTMIRFPVRPAPGDQIVVDIAVDPGRGRAAFSLFGIDGLTGNVIRLAEERAAGAGFDRVIFQMPPQGWWPDRFGLALDLYLHGGARVERVQYAAAGGTAPWQAAELRPGLNLVPAGAVRGVPVVWAFHALRTGVRRISRSGASLTYAPPLAKDRFRTAMALPRSFAAANDRVRVHQRALHHPLAGVPAMSPAQLEDQLAACGRLLEGAPAPTRVLAAATRSRQALRRRVQVVREEVQAWTRTHLVLPAGAGASLIALVAVLVGLAAEVLSWPFRIPAAIRWILGRLFFPWGYLDTRRVLTFDDPRWQSVHDPAQMQRGGRRVLVLSHMFPHPDQPVSGPFVHEQVQALRRAGIDARVVCCRPYWMRSLRSPLRILGATWNFFRFLRASRDRWWIVDEVPVRYLPYLIFAPFWAHAWAYRMAVRSTMTRLQQEFQPELIHAHTGYLDGSAAQMLARAWGVPYVITEHTGPFSALMRRPVVQDTTLDAIRNAAMLVSVSTALQKDVLGYLGEGQVATTVIPNVVDVDRFTATRAPPGCADAPRLLFVGYFVPVKNLPLLFSAFAQVLAVKPRATLTLVGGGEDEGQTRAVLADLEANGLREKVAVRGFLPRDEVARMMREECDMLVLQSRSETFGCVVAEALSSGRPVVVTRCGGPEDIVTEPWMGALCDNEDPDALARGILAVSDRIGQVDPQRLAASARERFAAPSVARRLGDLYEELLRRRHAGADRPLPALNEERGAP